MRSQMPCSNPARHALAAAAYDEAPLAPLAAKPVRANEGATTRAVRAWEEQHGTSTPTPCSAHSIMPLVGSLGRVDLRVSFEVYADRDRHHLRPPRRRRSAAHGAAALRHDGHPLVICGGDLVDYGPSANETIALLASRGTVCIRGNHERWALSSPFAGITDPEDDAHATKLSAESLAYLALKCARAP